MKRIRKMGDIALKNTRDTLKRCICFLITVYSKNMKSTIRHLHRHYSFVLSLNVQCYLIIWTFKHWLQTVYEIPTWLLDLVPQGLVHLIFRQSSKNLVLLDLCPVRTGPVSSKNLEDPHTAIAIDAHWLQNSLIYLYITLDNCWIKYLLNQHLSLYLAKLKLTVSYLYLNVCSWCESPCLTAHRTSYHSAGTHETWPQWPRSRGPASCACSVLLCLRNSSRMYHRWTVCSLWCGSSCGSGNHRKVDRLHFFSNLTFQIG